MTQKFAIGDKIVLLRGESYGDADEEYRIVLTSSVNQIYPVCLISAKNFSRWNDAIPVNDITNISLHEMSQIAKISPILIENGYKFTKDGVDIFPEQE